MPYRIIRNNEENHLSEVKMLFSGSTEIVITSPFLSVDVMKSLGNYLTERVKNVTLITTLKPHAVEQFNKVQVLNELFILKKTRGFNLTVRIDNDLHGKIYIGKNEDKYVGCIISSANFTNNGLEHNHEWGVFMDNQEETARIHEQVMFDATMSLDESDLRKMLQYIKEHPEEQVENPKINAKFVDLLKPVVSAQGESVTYWIKPLGTSEEPVSENTLFGQTEHDITFAKYPQRVMAGDVLIAYAVKTQRMLSVYTATEEKGYVKYFKRERDKQWPWYVKCKNNTPLFGANWPNINLTLRELRESYLREFPDGLVSMKSQNLDALKHGHDHLRLDTRFAQYVIEKMMEINMAL